MIYSHPTTKGLWYWKPESDRIEWEVVWVEDSLITFLCLGSGEHFRLGHFYYEQWGGPVPGLEELKTLKTDKNVLDWVITNMAVGGFWVNFNSPQELRKHIIQSMKAEQNGHVNSSSAS